MLRDEAFRDGAAMPGIEDPDQVPHEYKIPEKRFQGNFMKVVDRRDEGGEKGNAAGVCGG